MFIRPHYEVLDPSKLDGFGDDIMEFDEEEDEGGRHRYLLESLIRS